jgi:hypothetical protein
MPENGRWDLIRRLKVKQFLLYAHQTIVRDPTKGADASEILLLMICLVINPSKSSGYFMYQQL